MFLLSGEKEEKFAFFMANCHIHVNAVGVKVSGILELVAVFRLFFASKKIFPIFQYSFFAAKLFMPFFIKPILYIGTAGRGVRFKCKMH